MLGYNIKQYRKVLHVVCSSYIANKQKNRKEYCSGRQHHADVFVFAYGCLVSWGLSKKEELDFLEVIKAKPFSTNSLAVIERDRFVYNYGDATAITTHKTFNADIIILESDNVQTKLAISYALAQSIQLESYESAIQKTIDDNAHFPHQLAQFGKLPLSRKDILSRIGKIFLARSFINLNSDYLEDPEYFWEHSSTENYYTMSKKFLDVQRRVSVLNQKLDVLHELFEILTNQLQHRHSSRLEMIVIFLIALEIVINLVKTFPA